MADSARVVEHNTKVTLQGLRTSFAVWYGRGARFTGERRRDELGVCASLQSFPTRWLVLTGTHPVARLLDDQPSPSFRFHLSECHVFGTAKLFRGEHTHHAMCHITAKLCNSCGIASWTANHRNTLMLCVASSCMITWLPAASPYTSRASAELSCPRTSYTCSPMSNRRTTKKPEAAMAWSVRPNAVE